ncbi:MAG: tetratricopeptide repeat protein [Nitrospirae bacterium]|nr:tetratricopeptide repeat protein [Nitrospirota bacterium]
MHKATQFLFSGDIDTAEKEFLFTLSLNSRLHRAHFGLGLVYLQKNKIESAEKSFRAALEIEPDYAPAFRGLGQVFELKKDFSGAVLNYQKAISLESKNKAFATDVAISRFRLSQIGETPEIALSVADLLRKGAAFLKDKKKEEALKEYQRALEQVPANLEALENAAVLLFETGRADRSLELFKKIVSIDPNILLAHLFIGNIDEGLGRIGEAWEEFQLIMQIGGKTPGLEEVSKARERLDQMGPSREAAVEVDKRMKNGIQLYEKEDLEGSQKEYETVLQIVPKNVKAKFGLGSILYKKEEFSRAKKLFIETVEIDPDLLRAYFLLGKIYLQEKEIKLAFEAFTKVKELEKKSINAISFKKEIEEAEKELAAMGNDLTTGLKIGKLISEGNDLKTKEEYEGARKKFREALALSPDNMTILENLGLIDLRETSLDLEEARQVFEKMTALQPDLPAPRLELGIIETSRENYEKAIFQFQEAIRLGQLDKKGSEIVEKAKKLLGQLGETKEKAEQVAVYLKSGNKHFQEEKWGEAEKDYRKALEIIPGQTRALYSLSLIQLAQKQGQEAEKTLRTLLTYDPDHLEAHLQLGLMLGARGEYQKGAKELETVLTLGKEGKPVQTAKKELDALKQKAEGEEHFNAGIGTIKNLDELEKNKKNLSAENFVNEKTSLVEKMVRELESAIKLNRDNPYYYYNLGFAYVQKFDLVSAEYVFKKAIEIKPDLLIAHFRLAVLYDLAGAPDSSLKEYERVIELGKPEDEEVKEAKLKEAELKTKIAVNEEAKGYAVIGSFLFSVGKFKEAGPLLTKATELALGNADFWYNLGTYDEAIKRDDLAEKDYAEAIRTGPNLPKPYFYLGIIQEKKGKIKEAYENFKNANRYEVNKTSPEASLTRQRIDFYEKRLSGSLSLTLLNLDSNANGSDSDPVGDGSTAYGLSLKYFHYKSLKLLLSTNFSSFNSVYYYSQILTNSERVSFESKWVDLKGFDLSLAPSLSVNFGSGGISGWNSQLSLDLQENKSSGRWFDFVITHVDYTYSVSAGNSFLNSIQSGISWTLQKDRFFSGALTTVIGLENRDVAARDDSNVSWNGSVTYRQPLFVSLINYLSGSLTVGYGQTYFKNPDSSTLQDGRGEVFRKNQSLDLSGALSYFLFKNISLSGSAGYHMISSSLPVKIDRDINDIRNGLTSSNGGYRKVTIGLSLFYSF